jgi:DNA-binding MarR family transcriptional regulator
MNAEDAAAAYADLFPRLYLRFQRHLHHTEYRPTPESLAVLRHIATAGPLTVTEAAQHMDRSQAAMSELIGRLVSRDVLTRFPDERDRRRTLIWITDLGRETLAEANRVLSPDRLRETLEDMDPTKRETLIDLTRELLEGGEK